MKILVCIKQVADMESRFVVSEGASWFEETDLAFRINEYDEFAIEAAVQLKASLGEAEVTVLSAGPQRASDALKKALAMGADKAVLLLDPEAPKKDSWQVANLIADWAKPQGFDLVLTGMQSQDRGSGQVSLFLGELIGANSVSCAVALEASPGSIKVERELEGGLRAQVELSTPALVSCQLGLNQPRYPTLPNIMKAKKKPFETIEVTAALDPAQEVLWMGAPEKAGAAELIEGDLASQVERVVSILKDKKLVG